MASTRQILPPAEKTRQMILDSGVAVEELEAELKKLQVNPILKANEASAYAILARRFKLTVDTPTITTSLSEDDKMPGDQALNIKEFKKTTFKLLSVRAWFLFAANFKKDKNQNPYCMSIWGDETGTITFGVGGSKVADFSNGIIKPGTPILIGNAYVNKDKRTGMNSLYLNDKTNLTQIEVGDYGLQPLAELETTKINELVDAQYQIIRGIVTSVQEQEVMVNEDGQTMNTTEEGAIIRNEKTGKMDTAIKDFKYTLSVADETGEAVVVIYPGKEIDTSQAFVGAGIIVNGNYKEQYNSISLTAGMFYDAIGEMPPEEAPKEVKEVVVAKVKETIELTGDFDNMDFSCDEEAENPTEQELIDMYSFYKKTASMFSELTPAQFQTYYKNKSHKVYKVRLVIEKLFKDKAVRMSDRDPKMFMAGK